MPLLETHPSEIKIEDFNYDLPDHRIARYPLPQRDQSKLLVYRNGNIEEAIFNQISDYIPEDTLVLFNEAKVVHARLHFKKQTGALIEVFCLEPDSRYPDVTTAMMQESQVCWKCLVKGAAKWKDDSEIELVYTGNNGSEDFTIKAYASKVLKEGNSFIICFRWELDNGKNISFSEFLEKVGEMPIPPYLKREAEQSDEQNYQTIFAKNEGSVAAPTAALHFTPEVLQSLEKKNILFEEVTLHVGAGTFMPVKSEKMEGHQMHSEWIEVSLNTLEKIYRQLSKGKLIIATGTTSARTIESIYWIGVQILRKEWTEEKLHHIAVSQWYPYLKEDEWQAKDVVKALINYLKENHLSKLITKTQLIITPGYEFKILNAIITNFHQPSSTLLLMIAALTGNDWKRIYQYALEHEFRFLSYGDSSLLWRK